MKAIWNGTIIAESHDTKIVEHNHYFPPDSVKMELLRETRHRSTCPWKGEAHYYDLVIKGEENRRAAWYYPAPKKAASNIKGHVAFWRGVEIQE